MCDQANQHACDIFYDLQLENDLLATQITELKKEIAKDLNDFNWKYDIEDAGVQAWINLMKKWAAK